MFVLGNEEERWRRRGDTGINACHWVVLLNEQFPNERKRSLLKEFRCFDDILESNYFHPHKLFTLKISLIALLLT